MNPSTSQQALQNLQQAQGSLTDPNAILTARENALGVPAASQQVGGLRNAITDTTNLLRKIAPGVQGRTMNSLVTSGQQNRIIQNEQAPVAANLNQFEQQYGEAQSDYDRLLQQALQQSQLQAQGENQKVDNAKSIYAALYQSEQDALQAQLAREQMANQLKAARIGAGGGGGLDLNGLFNKVAGADAATAAGKVDPNRQKAIDNLANIVKNARNVYGDKTPEFYRELVNDYKATLNSAQKGNAVDKVKLNEFVANFPEVFGSQGSAFKVPLQTYNSKPGAQGLTYLKAQLNPFNSQAYTNALYAPAQVGKGLYNFAKGLF